MRLPRSRVASPRSLLLATTIAAALGGVPVAAAGQAGVTHADNAVPVPRGMLRLSVIPSWTRYDARFTGSGTATEPLGAVLTSDALGSAELPALTRLEAALRALTGDPDFRLSLGASTAFASVRVVTTPLTLEYGLTRRVSFGVTVPIVQRQREMLLDIHARDGIRVQRAGNVGPSAAAIDPAVHAAANQLASQLNTAAGQLEAKVAACAADPGAAGCAAIDADRAGAMAAVQETRLVAMSVLYVYGTSPEDPGVGLVPRARLSAEIATRLQALNGRLATYLGGNPVPTQVPPRGAAGPVAAGDVRDLARRGVAGLGPDSLARISRIGIGDVEIGTRILLWDSRPARAPRDSVAAAGPRARVVVGALARLATGEPPGDHELFAVGGGDGQADAEGMLAVDVDATSRLGATVVARYTAQLGEVGAFRLPDANGSLTPFGDTRAGTRRPGDILALEVSPRYWLANSLFLAAHYGFTRRADDAYAFPTDAVVDPIPIPGVPALPAEASRGGYTEQRAGFSLSYSTVAEWERGRVRLPIEVSYTHLETFAGSSAMVPRAGRDQILVRVYYPLLRR